MSEQRDVPVFGSAAPGYAIVPRPSAYGLILNATDRLAIVRSPEGTFLPGGGIEAGETAVEATIRETLEECGLVIVVNGASIGTAHEIVWEDKGKRYRDKVSEFFRASITGHGTRAEHDHTLMWVTIGEALDRLEHQSHRWAIQRVFEPAHINHSVSCWEKLESTAYQLAERHRDDEISWVAAILELESQHPGFTHEEYERALGDGMFASR